MPAAAYGNVKIRSLNGSFHGVLWKQPLTELSANKYARLWTRIFQMWWALAGYEELARVMEQYFKWIIRFNCVERNFVFFGSLQTNLYTSFSKQARTYNEWDHKCSTYSPHSLSTLWGLAFSISTWKTKMDAKKQWYLSQYSTFDWDANFAVWYSLSEFCYSPRRISNSTSYIFNSTLEFSFPLVFGSFVHHALWKKGVCRQHTSFTSCQNAACSFET